MLEYANEDVMEGLKPPANLRVFTIYYFKGIEEDRYWIIYYSTLLLNYTIEQTCSRLNQIDKQTLK